MSLVKVTANICGQLRKEGAATALNSIVNRVYVRWFEWHLGIRSEAVIELKELGIENEQCRPYVPTDYRTLQKLLDSLSITAGEDVFLDFGSGLGRVVLLAARRPFRKVIGVEISEQLNEVARENLQRARRLRCQNVELITSDATQFSIPPEVTIIYFFNPFRGEILRRVLDNIRSSLRSTPRRLTIVCKMPATSDFETEICREAWLKPERELKFSSATRYRIFRAETR